MAAIEMRLAEGWKTYWRAPGDAGIPPLFNWSRVQNASSIQMAWPTPEAFDTAGQRTLGYADKVIVPMIIAVDDANKDIRLKGRMDIGVCYEICLPVTVRFNTTLPKDGKRDAAILAAMIDQPLTAQDAGVRSTTCKVDVLDDGIRVTAQINLPHTGGSEIAVIEHPNKEIWVAQATAKRTGDILTATARMLSADGSPILINRSELRFTVLGTDHAVDIKGCTAD